jgi:hypothetical protein
MAVCFSFVLFVFFVVHHFLTTKGTKDTKKMAACFSVRAIRVFRGSSLSFTGPARTGQGLT